MWDPSSQPHTALLGGRKAGGAGLARPEVSSLQDSGMSELTSTKCNPPLLQDGKDTSLPCSCYQQTLHKGARLLRDRQAFEA